MGYFIKIIPVKFKYLKNINSICTMSNVYIICIKEKQNIYITPILLKG